jgi:hypothetical protein
VPGSAAAAEGEEVYRLSARGGEGKGCVSRAKFIPITDIEVFLVLPS